MNIENLARATEIQILLPELRHSLKKWKGAISLRTSIDLTFSKESQISSSYAPSIYVPFEVIKTISISGFEKEIAKLEAEFENL